MNTPREKQSLRPAGSWLAGGFSADLRSPFPAPELAKGYAQRPEYGLPGHAARQASERLPRNSDGKRLQNPAIPTVPIYSWENESMQTDTRSSTCSESFQQNLLRPSHGRHGNTALA